MRLPASNRRAGSMAVSEHPVRGVPGPDTLQNLVIFGDAAVTETRIQVPLVRRGEDGVEALIEEERHGEVPQPMVPLIGYLDASAFRDVGDRDPIEREPVHHSAGRV